ncbi:class I SAM-dependent methyltransferase [Oscillatoria sp. FACHB-1406]|uniref:class I SAM-dependent methyltransferase n=1 Tax=Oscillatoria sp. FACHB-1406 TaxID=2692846 RepID=UPI0016850D28|nr:class I SAM-dependent methyltransferase [Oscillatoria sp. FACHB-1406]MBD2579412.1 class I SAM-dependent methyltransferase [Oscillatoria sp. FACHB-1406]
MTEKSYVFSETQAIPEKERLETLQLIFDPDTHSYLQQIGIEKGWNCLEVGAGAGSIMHYLCDRVDESGRVVAVDIDPRFIEATQRSNLEIRRLDIVTTELEPNCYDLVHVRAVLMHLCDRDSAIKNLFQALKPGGWLLVEEPDFTHALPVETESPNGQCIARVFEATRKLYETLGVDPYFGRKLPLIFNSFNFEALDTATNTALFQGGSQRAKIWKMAIESIGQRAIDTDFCSSRDVANFLQLIDDPAVWMLDYAIMAVWGKKSAS